MKCHLRWGDDEKSILVIELQPGWDWRDFYALHPEYTAMLDSVEHEVHLIYLPQEGAAVLPPNSIYHMRRLMMTMTHPREGYSMIVAQMPVLQSVLRIMKNMYGVRRLVEKTFIVATLDEAYHILAEHNKACRNENRVTQR